MLGALLYALLAFLGYGMAGSPQLVSEWWLVSALLYAAIAIWLVVKRNTQLQRKLYIWGVSVAIAVAGFYWQEHVFAVNMRTDCSANGAARSECADFISKTEGG